MNETAARSGLRVLVVDDNRDAADSLACLVKLWGHDVRVAYDGAAGFRVARESPPDCLISDICMPGVDGYALASRIRGDVGLARVKLVAHSSYSDADHARKAAEAGFDYRLTKPAGPAELEELLRMIEQIKELAARTQDLTRKNVELAGEAKELLREVKEDIQEVKEEVRELKKEVRELKDTRDGEASAADPAA